MISEPPTVRVRDIVSSYGLGNKDNLELARGLKQSRGDVFRIPYHPGLENEAYVVADPEIVGEILQKQQNKFRKPKDQALLDFRHIMGNGLVASEGSVWLKQTRMIQPELMKSKLEKFTPEFEKIVEKHLQEWKKKEKIYLLDSIKSLTIEMMGNSLFGEDILEHESKITTSLDVLRDAFKQRTESIIKTPLWLPTPENKKLYQSRDTLREVARKLIKNRKQNPKNYEDIFSKLMKMTDPVTEEQMSDTQLQDEVVSFIVAGHETTASAITWTLYLLAKHKSIQEKARNEAKEKTNINNMTYNRNVFNESLRLYPTVPMFSRVAKNNTTIKNYKFKKNKTIIISPYLIHRDPQNWNHPHTFQPNRFKQKYNEYTFIPFSKGGHACTGQQLARIEAMTTLKKTFENNEIKLEKIGQKPGLNSGVNLIPNQKIPVRIL